MVYSINKQLDIQFIYPSDDVESQGKFNYPNSCLIVKLKSKRMPHKLVEQLIKKTEQLVAKLATDKEGGKPQLIPAFEFLRNILENNNLIPAWSELPEIRSILHLEKNSEGVKHKDELKLFERAGKIKLKLRHGPKVFLDLELTVPEEYPFKRPELKFVEHNLDPNFSKLYQAGAE